MTQALQKHAVNWQGGMQISRDHLIAAEDYLMDRIRDTAHLATGSFGLLPAVNEESTNLDYTVEADGEDSFSVSLRTCRALTPNGSRIEILNLEEPLVGRCDMKEATLFNIYVGINADERVPFGTPDSEEEPPRLPHARPANKISILPADAKQNLSIGSRVQIGQAQRIETRVQKNETYIPPCFTINASQQLLHLFMKFSERLTAIERDTINLVRNSSRIFQEGSADQTLVYNVHNLAEKIMALLTYHLDEVRLVYPNKNPVYLVAFFAKFARLLQNYFASLQDVERGKTRDYILKFGANPKTPSQFTDLLATLTKTGYNHHNMSYYILLINKFLETWGKITHDLSQHDFIGRDPSILRK